MKTGVCGSIESNDCLITVRESSELKIEINSIVGDFFYEQIKSVIESTLREKNIEHIDVLCEDKGALDYTIRARLLTAIQRMEER